MCFPIQQTNTHKQVSGAFTHNSWNIEFRGGVFADNRRQIEIHRADNVIVDGATVIGQTESYQKAIERSGSYALCPTNYGTIQGITIHSFLFSDSSPRGPTLRNVNFSNFTDAGGCQDTAAIFVHDDEVEPSFDSWTKFSGLTYDTNTVDTKFTMCKAVAKGSENVIMEVADASLYGSPGFLISDNQPELVAFDTAASCQLVPEACLQFCANACLQAIQLLLPATPDTDGMQIEIESGGMTQLFSERGLKRSDDEHYQAHRTYMLSLPAGTYNMRFIKNGAEMWPVYIKETRPDAPDCMQGSSGVTLNRSAFNPTTDVCSTLVEGSLRNGDLETGTLGYWKHIWSDVDLLSGGYGGSSFGIRSARENSFRVGQDLDTNCLNEGDVFEVSARVRMVDGSGNVVDCDPNLNSGNRCMYATAFYDTPEGRSYFRAGATISSLSDDNGWKLLHGTFTVSEKLASAHRVFLYIEYARGFGETDELVVKKVLPGGATDPVVRNGDFETGDHRYWPRGWSEGLTMVTPGADGSNTAVKSNPGKWIRQYLSSDALVAGKWFRFEAKFKMEGATNTCNPSVWDQGVGCPRVVFYSSFTDGTESEWKGYLYTAAPYIPGQFNLMYGHITITEKMATTPRLRLSIEAGPDNDSIILDNVSFVEEPTDCSSLIRNGNAAFGDTRGWEKRGSAILGIETDATSGDTALKATTRAAHWHGMQQYMDSNCLVEGATYTVSARMKLVDESTGQPHACTTGIHWGDQSCPVVAFMARHVSEGNRDVYVNVWNTKTTDWVADDWNDYSATFTISEDVSKATWWHLYIDRAPPGIAIIVDDLTVVQA